MKKLLVILLATVICISCVACSKAEKNEIPYISRFETENTIAISDREIKLNGEIVADEGDVFVSNDIIYYEDKEAYESGNPYGEGEVRDRHTKEEALPHTVLNITKSGAYRISGNLTKGQIRVDLGADAKENPDAVVELILDNANITCTVAPAILFMNVYECDGNWSVDSATFDVDTASAGANLILADKSENNINGSYVAKIFKDTDEEKKLYKQDGAIYSYMSMNVFGGGKLNLTAANEGLDTELHLTINGGEINIFAQNDGINTNEDGVSVTTINGGNVNIVAGLGEEGDGIDSNGWLVINGGTVISSANPIADAGLDSDLGSFINGGTVIALGSTMDWPESDSEQVAMNLQFNKMQSGEDAIVIKDKNEKIVFAYCPTKSDRGYRGAVISVPDFKVNEEYLLYIGGTLLGSERNNLYYEVKEYTDGIKQGYYSSDLAKGHRPPNGMKPEGFPEMPDGERPPMPPDGEMPDFSDKMPPEDIKGERPKPSEGIDEKTFDGNFSPMHGEENIDGKEQKTGFVMSDKVNLFTGVSEIK